MWLSLALGLVSLLRYVASWFSAESTLRRLELRLERRRAAEAVEAERLEATFRRIEAEPPRTPQAMLDRLKKHFGPKP